MQVDISNEVYEHYRKVVELRFYSDDVSHYIESLVIMELRRFAEHPYNVDQLTGCKTGYQLERDISRLTNGSGWQDHDLFHQSYLCVDIANFKNYNDYHGLPEGDLALTKVAEALGSAYPQHTIYRVGGDEFVVDLRGALETESLPAIKAPDDVSLNFAVVQITARKNHPQRSFIDRAIRFHIEEGVVKATKHCAKLRYDYTGT